MTPIDACPPAVIVETDMPDAAAEEMEWLKLEATYLRDSRTGMLYEPPTRVTRGVAVWTNTGMGKTARHPRAYRVKGENAGLPSRAKSPIDAARQLDAFPSVTYSPPQLGPWDIYDSYGKGMGYKPKGYTYIPSRGVWR